MRKRWGCSPKKRYSSRNLFSILLSAPWLLHGILHISFLVRSRYDGECTLTQLAWRQWTRCCPFLSTVRIKLRTLPCIDLQRSLCLGAVRFDKLFASPTGFISKAVLVWLNARLFFVIPSDGKWTRDVLFEWLRRFPNEPEKSKWNRWHLQDTYGLFLSVCSQFGKLREWFCRRL